MSEDNTKYQIGTKVLVEAYIKDIVQFGVENVYIMGMCTDTHLDSIRAHSNIYVSPAGQICVYESAICGTSEESRD